MPSMVSTFEARGDRERELLREPDGSLEMWILTIGHTPHLLNPKETIWNVYYCMQNRKYVKYFLCSCLCRVFHADALLTMPFFPRSFSFSFPPGCLHCHCSIIVCRCQLEHNYPELEAIFPIRG